MTYCSNCGAPVEGRFCAKCGTPVSDAAAPGAAYSAPSPGPAPAAPLSAPGLTDNVAGLLCYLGGVITGVLFLLLAPYNTNRFVRFHAMQSIFTFLGLFILSIAITTIAALMPFGLMALFGLLTTLVWLAGIVLWIVLMVKAYNGERFHLPVVGDLAEKQS